MLYRTEQQREWNYKLGDGIKKNLIFLFDTLREIIGNRT